MRLLRAFELTVRHFRPSDIHTGVVMDNLYTVSKIHSNDITRLLAFTRPALLLEAWSIPDIDADKSWK